MESGDNEVPNKSDQPISDREQLINQITAVMMNNSSLNNEQLQQLLKEVEPPNDLPTLTNSGIAQKQNQGNIKNKKNKTKKNRNKKRGRGGKRNQFKRQSQPIYNIKIAHFHSN